MVWPVSAGALSAVCPHSKWTGGCGVQHLYSELSERDAPIGTVHPGSSALSCQFTQSTTNRTVQATLSRWRHGFESRWGCNKAAGRSRSSDRLFDFRPPWSELAGGLQVVADDQNVCVRSGKAISLRPSRPVLTAGRGSVGRCSVRTSFRRSKHRRHHHREHERIEFEHPCFDRHLDRSDERCPETLLFRYHAD